MQFHDRKNKKIVDLPSVDEIAQHAEFGSLYGRDDDWEAPTCKGCNQPEPECESLEECSHGIRRKMERRYETW